MKIILRETTNSKSIKRHMSFIIKSFAKFVPRPLLEWTREWTLVGCGSAIQQAGGRCPVLQEREVRTKRRPKQPRSGDFSLVE